MISNDELSSFATREPQVYGLHAGRFAGDPVFDEIVKLGISYPIEIH